MYPKWVAGRRLRAYRWLEPRALVEKCHKVAMDTSHLTVAREDVLEAYRVLAPKLVHVHLSDNAGDGRDGHLELEQGIVPIDRFLGELRRTKYGGTVSLELSVSRYVEKPEDLVPMFRRNREYLETKLTQEPRKAKGMPRR
jgi:sugar phosphate isomerase/epimerase